MRTAGWVLASVLALGCRSPAPAGADAGPIASASPDVGPERLGPEAAKALVRGLPEVDARTTRDPAAKLEIDPSSAPCERSGSRCDYVISVGRGRRDVTEMVFLVDAASGAIAVDTDRHEHFTRAPITLGRWRDELLERPKVAARVAALPEVSGLEKGLRAQGLDLALWLETEPPLKECGSQDADCSWVFYVGEGHPDHSVRRVSVLVQRSSGEISVAGMDGKAVPYSEWAKTGTAKAMRQGK